MRWGAPLVKSGVVVVVVVEEELDGFGWVR